MKLPRPLCLVCLLIVAFILVGCEAAPVTGDTERTLQDTEQKPEEKRVMIFYKRGNYLVPVAMKADPPNPEAKTAVDILLSGTLPDGFENLLSDVSLNTFSLDGDTVTIDLSKDFLTGEAATKRDQLVYTLMWCDNIAKVDLYVDGDPVDNILKRPWGINLQSPEVIDPSEIDSFDMEDYLTVYFIDDKTKKYMVPVTLKSDKIALRRDEKGNEISPSPVEKAKAALLHLAEGPGDLKDLMTIFPQNLKAKTVEVKDTTAYVDVDGKLLVNLAGEVQDPQLAVESIVLTLTSIDGIERVQLMINGNVGHFAGGKPIPRLKWYNSLQ